MAHLQADPHQHCRGKTSDITPVKAKPPWHVRPARPRASERAAARRSGIGWAPGQSGEKGRDAPMCKSPHARVSVSCERPRRTGRNGRVIRARAWQGKPRRDQGA